MDKYIYIYMSNLYTQFWKLEAVNFQRFLQIAMGNEIFAYNQAVGAVTVVDILRLKAQKPPWR